MTDESADTDTDGDARGGTDRAGGPPACPHCGRAMYSRHCKYVCPSHGVVIDCSDPFR